jgi:lipoprotein-anchoring transpeptidase ErfK/SrfK
MSPGTVALAFAFLAPVALANAQDPRIVPEQDTALRVVVSIRERRLRVIDGEHDTLLVARVAVGSGRSISYGARRWRFETPIGVRSVVAKDSAPLWIPPDWHYVELARRSRLRIVWLHGDTTMANSDGSTLVIDRVGARLVDEEDVEELPMGKPIIVENVLYVPPIGSAMRRVPGELGEFRLSLGSGVGIHGTPDKASIGKAVTHGCMRLDDADIAWLYRRIPVGTKVYIY